MAEPALVQPQAYTEDGKVIPPEQYAEAAAAGKAFFAKGQRVFARDARDRLITVDAADVTHPGIRIVNPDELAAVNEKRQYGKGFGNEAKAAAAGAARTLTFGGSDVAARALGGSETANALGALKRQNPISSGVGEVAGAIAPLLLSGGAGAGAEGAALGTGALEAGEAASALKAADGLGAALRATGRAAGTVPRAISGAGSIVERGVARGLESLGGKGVAAKTLKRAAELGAQGAVEGGLYGAQGAISDQALEDHDQTVENFVSGLGHGALLGAGLGATLGAIGELGGAALTRSKGSLEKVAKEHAGRAIGGQAELRKLDKFAPQATTDALHYTMQTGEHAGQPLIAKGDKVDDIAAKLSHAVEEVGAKRNGVMSEIDSALQSNPAAQKAAPSAREFVEQVKSSDWYKALKNGPDRGKARAVDKQLGYLLEPVEIEGAAQAPTIEVNADAINRRGLRESSFEHLRAHPETGNRLGPPRIDVWPDVGPQVGDGRHRLLLAAERGETSIDARVIHFDREGNAVSDEVMPIALTKAGPDIRAVREVAPPLPPERTGFLALKDWQERLRDVFQPRAGSAGGIPPQPPKAAAYLEKMERELKTYLDGKAESALAALGEDPNAYKTLTRQLHSMLSLREVAKKTINHGNRLLSPSDHGTGIAAFLASAVSGHTLGGLVYGGATALANNLMRTRGNATLAALARDASEMGGTLESTARKLTGKTTEAASSIAALEASPRAVETGRAHDMPRPPAAVPALAKQFNETIEQVRRLATPEIAGQHVSGTVEGLSAQYPDVGSAASRKLLDIYQHLAQAIPPAANSPAKSLTPRSVKPMVPPTAMRTYLATVRGAVNPRAVIADLGRGELDRDALAAVQQFYPKTFQALRSKVADFVAEREEDLPYQQTIFLSTAFGFIGDSSLEPKNVAAIQQTFADMQKTGETQQSDRPVQPAPQSSIDATKATNSMRLPSAQQQDT